MAKNTREVACSFCGTRKQDAMMLIAGDGAHICDRCITQAGEILAEELNLRKSKSQKYFISKLLSLYIFGFQEICPAFI